MRTASQRSLEVRLPALMGVLLLLVVGSLSWIAHRELERALLASVQDRLEGAQSLLSNLLAQSFEGRRAALAEIASRPEIVAPVTAPNDSTILGAVPSLAQVASSSNNIRAAELWSSSGECLARIDRPAPAEPVDVPTAGELPGRACHADPATVSGGAGVGPIRMAGEGVVYDFVVPVGGDGPSPSPGRLVEVRYLSEARGVELIEGLIGSDAHIYVGANRGDVWSDLSVPVAGPPVDSTTRGLVRYTDGSGQSVVGVAGPLPGAPWLVWVQFPQDIVFAPQRAFVRRAGIAMIVILLLGSAGAWTVGRRIATPLRHVTEAAEEIASGLYSSRVARTSNDETGRLASAFNSMAERIETDHHELEHRVAARTNELHGTLVQLREAQDQLVRREKLAMLGQLASGVGHELRNPLGVMSNAVYYLEMVLDGAPPQVREYLGIIKGQIALSEKIVGDLLDFARIKPPRSDIVTLETLASDQLSRLTPPPGVRIVSDFPQNLPEVHVDRVQMGQVVLNLLTNAFQAMEDGTGTLTLRGVEVAPGRLRLDVTDTGVGISEEDLAKIFEPLYTTKARGIGLGLAVARSLAEANRGTLSVTSRPGEGATFSLELPTSAREAAA